MFRAGAISTARDLSGVRLEREREREREILSRIAYTYVDTRCIREREKWASIVPRVYPTHACHRQS